MSRTFLLAKQLGSSYGPVWSAMPGIRYNSGCLQVTIHPDKRLSGSESGRRILTLRQAAVQMPGYEDPLAFQIDVRAAATGFGHIGKWLPSGEALLSKFATARVPGPGRAPRQARVPAPRAGYE